jgi:hypothetical protein
MKTSQTQSRTARINLLLGLGVLFLAIAGCITPTCDVCRGYRPGATYNLTYPPGDANAVGSAVADSQGCLHYPRPDSTGNCGSVKATLAGLGFFFLSPSPFDFQAPASTITVMGDSIDATYGPPKVVIMQSGAFVAQPTVTAVSGDGTWVQASTPDLTYMYTGTYDVEVSAMDEYGSYYVLSYATMEVVNNDPPPPPDPVEGDPDPCRFDGRDWYCY